MRDHVASTQREDCLRQQQGERLPRVHSSTSENPAETHARRELHQSNCHTDRSLVKNALGNVVAQT